jgi:translation initiation factor IF-3
MDIGQAILDRIAGDLEDVGVIEFKPKIEGRNLFMIVAPKAKAK